MKGNGWTAQITITTADGGLHMVQCRVMGETHNAALFGATYVMKTLAKGRQCYVRKWPAAMTERDHDTQELKHMAFARFTYTDEPGEWIDAQSKAPPPIYTGDVAVDG